MSRSEGVDREVESADGNFFAVDVDRDPLLGSVLEVDFCEEREGSGRDSSVPVLVLTPAAVDASGACLAVSSLW